MQHHRRMVRGAIAMLFSVMLLCGCKGQPATNAADTGGGGIGPHQNHPDIQGKSSTESGKSPQAQATGRVPNGGAEVPENWNSPSESNGGTGGSPAPELVRAAHAGAASQGKTADDQSNNNPAGR